MTVCPLMTMCPKKIRSCTVVAKQAGDRCLKIGLRSAVKMENLSCALINFVKWAFFPLYFKTIAVGYITRHPIYLNRSTVSRFTTWFHCFTNRQDDFGCWNGFCRLNFAFGVCKQELSGGYTIMLCETQCWEHTGKLGHGRTSGVIWRLKMYEDWNKK